MNLNNNLYSNFQDTFLESTLLSMAAHLHIATFLFNTHIFNSYIETACRYHISAVVIAADIKFNTNTALSVSLFVALSI